ncbi:hypothetical protein G3M48_007695 [Beauveria asiatica]|uniref:Uncharacterized protein n=1 Tax=Beauveria asiatica TaxID=1069075 RepID=A0AAW0RME7_9HYPO
MAELNELCNRITADLDLLGPALRITSLCLLEDIEPADRKLWPPAVCDTLSKLAEEELRECRNLQKLVSELSQPLHAMDCGSQDLRPPAVRSSLQHQSLDRGKLKPDVQRFMLIKYRDEAYVYGCARSKCSEVTSAISDGRLEQR